MTDSFSNNGTDTLPGIALNGPAMFAVTAAGETLQVSGAITGAFAITKTGCGVLLLSGTSTYSGGTMVSAGTLLVNAATLGAGGVVFRINYASATLTAIASPASIPALTWPGAIILSILMVGLGMRMLPRRTEGGIS